MSTLVMDGTLPRSRATDPVTSVDAGRAADLTRSQSEVLAVFELEGRPLADHELVAAAGRLGSRFSAQRIRSARSELAERDLVRVLEGEYRQTESGKRARVWVRA